MEHEQVSKDERISERWLGSTAICCTIDRVSRIGDTIACLRPQVKPRAYRNSLIRVPCIQFLRATLLVQVITISSRPILAHEIDGSIGGGDQVVVPRSRTVPAERILLENGSTTYISTLEEFLSGTEIPIGGDSFALNSSTVPRRLAPNADKIPVLDQSEREGSRQTKEPPRGESFKQTNQVPSSSQQDSHLHSNSHSSPNHERNSNQLNSSASVKPIPQHWQVKSLLNVSNDYPLAYSQIICGYVWPLMAALTLFTNLMIVFILTQRDMRTPTNVVLTAIAIADIIPIVVPVPWFVYLFAMGNEKQVLYPPIACYFYQHSTRSVSEVFYFLSTWLNVLLAVQDYLAACWPNLAKKYCQIRVVVVEILSLTLLAFLLNLPQALKLVFKPVKFYYNGQLTWGCRAMQAKWFKDLVGEYVALYDDIFTATIVVFVDGGPAMVLITLTALLIRQLKRQRIQGHLLMEQARTASKRRRERNRQQEYESSARVMIFVLLAFLAVKIPFATTYTLMIIQSRFDIHFVENLVDFQKAITLTDLVFVLSYPLNFTIFCLCSKKFRHKCAQLLGECNSNTKSARGRLMKSISGSFTSESMSQGYQRNSIATIASQNGPASVGKRPSSLSVGMKQNLIANQFEPSNYRVCDKTCEGNKLFKPTPTFSAEMSPQFRALLGDGSICVECIMRYEQLKRSNGQLDLPRDNSAGGAWPPSPPPLPMAYQLPNIVTTRCESIREMSDSDEALESRAKEEEEDAAAKDDQFSMQNRARNNLRRASALLASRMSSSSASASEDSLLQQLGIACGLPTGFRDGGGQQSAGSAKKVGEQRVSSYPGSSLLHAEKQNRRQSNSKIFNALDRNSSHSGENRDQESNLIMCKQRSLSLSNSRLSTLPNATGLLADVLMQTLLAVRPQNQTSLEELPRDRQAGGNQSSAESSELSGRSRWTRRLGEQLQLREQERRSS